MNPLFIRNNLHTVLCGLEDGARSSIEDIPADEILKQSPEKLAKEIAEKKTLEPISLDSSKLRIETQETSGPPKGVIVSVKIPFSGDAELFMYKPNQYDLSPPRAVVYEDEDSVSLQYDYDNVPSKEQIKKDYTSEISNIEKNLHSQQNQIDAHNQKLPSLLIPLIEQRREHLKKLQKLQQDLGGSSAVER